MPPTFAVANHVHLPTLGWCAVAAFAPPRHVRVARCLCTFAPAAERARGVFWRRQLVDVHGAASR